MNLNPSSVGVSRAAPRVRGHLWMAATAMCVVAVTGCGGGSEPSQPALAVVASNLATEFLSGRAQDSAAPATPTSTPTPPPTCVAMTEKNTAKADKNPAADAPPAPPVLRLQPQPLVVADGTPARFAVMAEGRGLRFQWRRDGVDIAGARDAALLLAAATRADTGGHYSAMVCNPAGCVSSHAAMLIVEEAGMKMSWE